MKDARNTQGYKNIQSKIYIITFQGCDKSLYRFHFFNCIHKSINSYKNPRSSNYSHQP